MNWLLWVGYALKVALNLITHAGKFRKEIPEAVRAVRVTFQETLQLLDGGLTEAEIERIKTRVKQAAKEVEDVFVLIGDVIPLPKP